MDRFISYCNKRIFLISDNKYCTLHGCKQLKIDESLSYLSEEKIMNDHVVWNNKVLSKSDSVSSKDIKVAFISNYKSHCGISTYSEKLYSSLIPHLLDYKIFAEDNGDKSIDNEYVLTCWKRGEQTDKLVSSIKEYNPDVILIQHEYGMWPDARVWLSLLTQLNEFKTYVVLHSVYPNHADKTVCEMGIKNAIVHTNIAKNCLIDKKLNSNVIHIPHGCDEVSIADKPWNMYRSERTFIQFGFGFRYKGWENSLRVVAGLKREFPDVFFTGIFSESPFNKELHQSYFEELMKLVDELDIKNNVGFIRGFVDDSLLMKALMMNKVAVFPYIDNGKHQVFGCSGAARTALTAKIPVIVTVVPLFDDLEGICPRCNNNDEIIDNLRKFWTDKNLYKNQIEKQNKFLIENSWNNVAKKFLEEFCKLED